MGKGRTTCDIHTKEPYSRAQIEKKISERCEKRKIPVPNFGHGRISTIAHDIGVEHIGKEGHSYVYLGADAIKIVEEYMARIEKEFGKSKKVKSAGKRKKVKSAGTQTSPNTIEDGLNNNANSIISQISINESILIERVFTLVNDLVNKNEEIGVILKKLKEVQHG